MYVQLISAMPLTVVWTSEFQMKHIRDGLIQMPKFIEHCVVNSVI